MIIREGTAEEIHTWFLTEKTQEAVLCIFLGTTRNQIDELSNLIDSVIEVDAILGKNIGFLICSDEKERGSEIDLGYGEHLVIGARYKGAIAQESIQLRKRMAELDLHSLKHHGGDDYHNKAIKSLSRSTLRLTPNFMEIFGIRYNELPCIVTIFKGLDEFAVTACPNQFTKADIISWLHLLRSVTDQVDQDILRADMQKIDVGARVKRSAEYQREIDAKLKNVQTAVTGVCAKHKIDAETSVNFLAALCSPNLSMNDKERLLSTFRQDHPITSNDNRWEKIYNLIRKVDDLRQLDANSLNRSELQALEIQIRDEMRRISTLKERVADLKMQGLSSRSGVKHPKRRALKPWEAAEKINTAADIWEKLSSSLSFIMKLLQFT